MAKVNEDTLKIGVRLVKCKDCDREEVLHGRWITDGLGDGERICSVCRKYALYTHRTRYDQYLTDYCPKCGAKMDA